MQVPLEGDTVWGVIYGSRKIIRIQTIKETAHLRCSCAICSRAVAGWGLILKLVYFIIGHSSWMYSDTDFCLIWIVSGRSRVAKGAKLDKDVSICLNCVTRLFYEWKADKLDYNSFTVALMSLCAAWVLFRSLLASLDCLRLSLPRSHSYPSASHTRTCERLHGCALAIRRAKSPFRC